MGKPTLSPDGHGTFIDERGVTWETPIQWLFIGQMGGCGCGVADHVGSIAWALLCFYAGKCADESVPVLAIEHEIVALWLSREGLSEHGTSVTYSWLTEKGRQVHEQIRACMAAHTGGPTP